MATRITPLPTPVPQSSDPENFDPRADAFLTALPTFADEANQVAEEMDEAVDTAQAAASASLSNANFVGRWEDQSGPAAPPYSVFHGGLFWSLLDPIADVAASEPDPYNTDWAVTGAPAWYNNFAVGDYLDTARSPGAGWLRRNGAAYPKSTYPELAPLMPSIPASFVFDEKSSGVSENNRRMVRWGSLLVAWTGALSSGETTKVYFSEDEGETWDSVTVFGTARILLDGCIFDGYLLIGTDESQYLKFTSPSDYSIETIPGVDPEYFVSLAASPSCVIAVLRLPSSALIRRTVDMLTWTAPSISGTLPSILRVSWALGTFLASSGGPPVGTAVSIDDGASFTVFARGEPGGDLTLGNVDFLYELNGRLIGAAAYQESPSSRPSYFLIEEGSFSFDVVTDDSLEVRGNTMGKIFFLDGKYVWVTQRSSGGTIAYSWDLSGPWTYQAIPDQYYDGVSLGDRLAVIGSEFAVGRFFDSDSFRVPSDNPESGWIKAVSDSPGTVGYDGVPEAPMTGDDYVRNNGTWKKASGGGGMDYPGEGIPVSTGSAWGTSKTAPSGDLVGTTDAQALTNKTLGTGTKESVTAGSTVTVNDAAAPFQQITLTANATATINLSVGVSRTIWLNPGTHTVTWPAGTVLVGGIENLPASKWSLITFTGMPSNTAGMAALVGSQP